MPTGATVYVGYDANEWHNRKQRYWPKHLLHLSGEHAIYGNRHHTHANVTRLLGIRWLCGLIEQPRVASRRPMRSSAFVGNEYI